MTQPFGSCDILFSASLALAAPATNVATAPRQVASSNLRIAKPPTLFQVLFCFALGSDASSVMLDTNSISESRYTFRSKCYARHPERATEINICDSLRCLPRAAMQQLEHLHRECTQRRL